MSSGTVVLDSTALLALLFNERGADRVRSVLPDAVVSAVSLSEVLTVLAQREVLEHGGPEALTALALAIHPFDAEAAHATARLRLSTGTQGLSLGDRACMALAIQLGATALTADPAWTRLNVRGLDVAMIR